LKGKKRALMIANNQKVAPSKRAEKAEIAEWFTIWLQSPEIFENWIEIRKNSKDFQTTFGE